MKVIRYIKELQHTLQQSKLQGCTIGFVPTMGALHKGHLYLVNASVSQNKLTIVSIYVNPAQFNDKNDLSNYPRDLEKDCKLLEETGCNIVFAPNDQEMYPEPDLRKFEFGQLGMIMEGLHRPGHFNGVAKIVTRFFDIIQPNRAYFGRKDFQQLAIVRKMVSDFNYNIEIVACPIVRESDGLAMSSRNMLLSAEHRAAAPIIYKTLSAAKELFLNNDYKQLSDNIIKSIHLSPLLKVEYCQVVNSLTLQEVERYYPGIPVTICVAVNAGKIRLIDNIEFIS